MNMSASITFFNIPSSTINSQSLVLEKTITLTEQKVYVNQVKIFMYNKTQIYSLYLIKFLENF